MAGGNGQDGGAIDGAGGSGGGGGYTGHAGAGGVHGVDVTGPNGGPGGSGGSCTLSGSGGYTVASAAITAGNPSLPETSKGAGNSAGENGSISITAEPGFIVTPNAGANGSLSPNTAQLVASGASVTMAVTPASGYEIDQVSGCGGALSSSTFTTAAVTADCTVSATFRAKSVVVQPTVTPVPTLSEWGLFMLTLLASLLGMRHLVRRS